MMRSKVVLTVALATVIGCSAVWAQKVAGPSPVAHQLQAAAAAPTVPTPAGQRISNPGGIATPPAPGSGVIESGPKKGDPGQPGEPGLRGPCGSRGQRGPGMSKEAFARFLQETGGPASEWAAPKVTEALQRGPERGGLAGRQKGAKVTDHEWQAPANRQELAVVASRSASYAENQVRDHNSDASAHGGKLAQIPWIWLVLGLVLAVAVGGCFFPRLRLPIPGYYP